MTPQKDRLLFLLELLNRETDEQHPMTISEIIDRLKQASFACGWKSVRNDIDRLLLLTTQHNSPKTLEKS